MTILGDKISAEEVTKLIAHFSKCHAEDKRINYVEAMEQLHISDNKRETRTNVLKTWLERTSTF